MAGAEGRIPPPAEDVRAVIAWAEFDTAASGGGGGGTTYYVSTGGNDNNDGLSSGTAWATIAKVNAETFVAGDTILFERSGHWQTQKLNFTSSGVSGNPITIDAYGSGDPPTFDGGGNFAAGDPLNPAPGPWPQKGSWQPIELHGNWITLKNVRVQESNFAGIDVFGDDCVIDNCTVRWNPTGIETADSCQRLTIKNCTITDNSVMSVLTNGGDDDSGAFGILLHGDDAIIEFNTISNHRHFSYDYGFDGAAVEIYRGTGNIIRYNWSEENEAFTELGHTDSANNTYHHNVVISRTSGSIGLNIQGNGTFGPVLGTVFDHNTLYLVGSSSQGAIVGTGADCHLYNNIIQASWKGGYSGGPIDEDNNLYFGHSQLQIKSSNDTQGTPNDDIGDNSIEGSNPLFVDVDADDFHLQAGSPAINQGDNTLGYTQDYDGNPNNGVPDMGAFERQ